MEEESWWRRRRGLIGIGKGWWGETSGEAGKMRDKTGRRECGGGVMKSRVLSTLS